MRACGERGTGPGHTWTTQLITQSDAGLDLQDSIEVSNAAHAGTKCRARHVGWNRAGNLPLLAGSAELVTIRPTAGGCDSVATAGPAQKHRVTLAGTNKTEWHILVSDPDSSTAETGKCGTKSSRLRL